MRLIRILVFPISLVYAVVVYLRNTLYDIGVLVSYSFETPILCIGNLSTGGTGKTPMTEYIIALLAENYKVAVLSRGYKRQSKGYVLAQANSSVEDLGDEPYQIYQKFKKINLAVDEDRCHGISQLEKTVQPDIIILDDAFQHRKVKPSMNILLTSYNTLYSKDWYLPTGNLRDHKSQAQRADVIIVTKCPSNISEAERQEIIQNLNPNKTQQVLFSSLVYSDELISKDDSFLTSSIKNKDFTLITGIANSEPMVAYLMNLNRDFKHLKFKDHHNFSAKEVESFKSLGLKLTTEKDYVRLVKKVDNLYYLSIKHKFIAQGAQLLEEKIDQSLK